MNCNPRVTQICVKTPSHTWWILDIAYCVPQIFETSIIKKISKPVRFRHDFGRLQYPNHLTHSKLLGISGKIINTNQIFCLVPSLSHCDNQFHHKHIHKSWTSVIISKILSAHESKKQSMGMVIEILRNFHSRYYVVAQP